MNDLSTLRQIRDRLAELGVDVLDSQVGWSNRKTQYGQVNYRQGVLWSIVFSRTLWPHMSVAEREDTVIHEAAHARLPYAEKHGPRWQRLCRALGGSGDRLAPTTRELDLATAKYVGTCPTCRKESYRHRSSKLMNLLACGKCCNGTWKREHVLIWQQLR